MLKARRVPRSELPKFGRVVPLLEPMGGDSLPVAAANALAWVRETPVPAAVLLFNDVLIEVTPNDYVERLIEFYWNNTKRDADKKPY